MTIRDIVATPARIHIIEGKPRQYSMGIYVRTVCGKDLVEDGEPGTSRINHADSGFDPETITCKNCRRTVVPSKVLFNDERVAPVGSDDVVVPAEVLQRAVEAAVPDGPTVFTRFEYGTGWTVHVNFAGPESEPALFINGYEAEVTV